jgi:hypothetical protein
VHFFVSQGISSKVLIMRSASISFFAVCLAALVVPITRPQAAGAADVPVLRYGFEQGKHYLYDVKISAEIADEKYNRGTTFDYTVQSATEAEFTLHRAGTLVEPRRRAVEEEQGFPPFFMPQFGPPMPMGPSRPPFARGRFPSARPQREEPAEPASVPETTFTRNGDMVLQRNRDALPFLLGYEDMLVIEAFPKKPLTTWNTKNGVVVAREETETNRAAKEEVTFTIGETKGDIVQLTKKYSLKTEPDAKGISVATMTGSGDLAFDSKAGLFRSLDMKYSIVVTRANVSITIPVSLSYRHVSEEEMAKRQELARKAAEKAKKEAEARAEAAKPKPLTAETRAAALKDLKAADIGVAKEAAKRLAHALPGDNPDDEISAALTHAMKGGDDWAQAEFLGALAVWGTDNCERAVIACTKSGTWFVRDKAIDILGKKFTNQAAIDALAAQFKNNHGAVAAALKKIKSPAVEDAVLPFIKDVDFWLRNDAIGVLQEVGGQKSLRALKHELTKTWAHGNPLETGPFNGAIAAIERRLPDDDTPAEKPGEPKMRTWQDASGKFDVEATLVGVKDDKVTLKKKDGKQITLPVSKLSDEDQEYLKAQSKPKEVNPFE